MTNRRRLLDWLVRILAERAEEDRRQAELDAREDNEKERSNAEDDA